MAFRFKRQESIRDGVRRIADEQIRKVLDELDNPQLSYAKKVHQVRKRCKKLRGLIRLVRPGFEDTYQSENASFRDTARELSTLRDAKTMIDTYDALMEHFSEQVNRSAFGSIRQQLTLRRQKLREEQIDLSGRLATTTDQLRQARERCSDWDGDLNRNALAAGLEKTYDRGRQAMRQARKSPSPEAFHEWRKRVKYHWYHTRLLENIWPEILPALGKVAKQLSDWLGDDHDLAVLQQCVSDDPQAFGSEEDIAAFGGLIDRRRDQLQTRAFGQGRRLFFEKPRQLTDRWMHYWDIWRG